ncbi:MAG: serine/threonine protein kinase [Labilithrix sp.]|nr:serine/threonine protein kinase [Labilithrix sp.]MCW5814121.1 serine/threonine protein kinase [Labilithrix sp.]
MDERGARRLELVKTEAENSPLTSSGVVASKSDAAAVKDFGLTTGQLLDGKYLVGRVIGSGAVGIVFEAKNVELDETVAIKCLRPEMLVDNAMVGRFAREAKAAAAIKSEYVATVHDVGTTPEGMPYMVMEYLDGKDLGSVVEETGTVGPRTAVEYALQVCEALAVAHSKGIVHRDIKPENLLLTERAGGIRIVKVLDFGISKAALSGSIFKNAVPLVKTVNLMGTPLYMSPEQVRVTDSVDVRSDIWSLGMVIYEMLTGQTAFDGQSITEICAAILEAQPRPIEMFRNDLPSGLVEVITKCLQKDANKRFQNIAELAVALMPFGPKRTRLNVERAVAVLQAAGQATANLQVNSTMPPAPSDFLYTPIPRAPGLPTDTSSPPIPPSSVPIAAPSAPASAPQVSSIVAATESAPPPEKKRGFAIVLGVLAVAAIVAGALAATYRASPPPATAAAPVATPETKTSPPAPVTAAAPPATTTTAAAPSAAPVETADATATPAPATAAAPAQPFVGFRPATGTSRPALPRPKPSSAKSAAPASEEPDLGY